MKTQPTPDEAPPRHSGCLVRWIVYSTVLAAVSVTIALVVVAFAALNFNVRYAGLIYPGVSVTGIELGGLTVDQATEVLAERLPDPQSAVLTLRSGDDHWACPWSDLGLSYNPRATAELAFRVGRQGTPEEQYQTQLRALVAGHQSPPVVLLPDESLATSALQAMAPDLLVPPVSAGLVITPGGIGTSPAKVGRELALDETVAVLSHAFAFSPEGLSLELLTRPIEPALLDPGPVREQVDAILAEPFIATAYDDYYEFGQSWQISPEEIATWLGTRSVEYEDGPRLVLTIDNDTLYESIERLADQVAHERIALDVEATAPVIRAALRSGDHTAEATLVHPPMQYIVQRGDTLMKIAAKHGYPAWRLVEANPDIDINRLQVGQEIVIPSIDLLFPLPLVREQRIVVDISEQRLYAYEDGQLVYDFIASTGIKSSPTITGTFQVLSKEVDAYATNWDLNMPHFIAVYESAPGFHNGIHGLPSRTGHQVLWENALGRPVSFGCIVLGLEEAALIYDWAELGALVEIRQ